MSTVFNLVALGALGGFVLGKVKLKTAMIVGFGAIFVANLIPSTTTTTPTNT